MARLTGAPSVVPVIRRAFRGGSREGPAPPAKVEVRPRGASRREGWQRRLPLLPALIYTIVVTQIPFLVTLWYSFQNYFFDVPGGAHFTGLSNYKRSSPARPSAARCCARWS